MIRKKTDLGSTGAGRWAKRLALAVGGPVLLTVAAELALRCSGYGDADAFLVPSADRKGFVPNEAFGRAYHCPEAPAPFLLPAIKPAEAVWVFLLGESAAHGSPDPAFGPARALEILLQDRFPGKRVQVFNAAMMGLNSFAVERIARDCAAHEADLLIVYAGNNEFIGSFGVHHFANRFPSPLAQRLIRGVIAARASCIGQALIHLLTPAGPSAPQDEAFFLAHRIAADDPRRETVRANFEANLNAIASLARTNGPRVLFSTVAVNLRDWPPLASLGTNEQSAATHFLAARTAEHHGNQTTALHEYQAACRNDALPFRSDETLAETVRASAKAFPEVDFVDAADQLTRQEIPGDRWFVDHVHFRFAGSCALARILLDPATQAIERSTGATATRTATASDEALAHRLAYTAWDELKIGTVMLRVLSRPPCSLQMESPERMDRERSKQTALLRRFDTQALRLSVMTYEDALAGRPDDESLQQNFIELLDGIDQSEAALPYAASLLARHPQHSAYQGIQQHLLAKTRHAAGGPAPLGRFHFEHGTRLLTAGNAVEAIPEFRRSLAYDDHDPQTHNNLGAALLKAGATNEAIAELERTVTLMPGHAGAHLNLGLALCARHAHAEAALHLRRAVALNAPSPVAAIRLAWLLATTELDELRNGAEALQLAETACAMTQRKDPAALASLAAAYAACGRFQDALAAFTEQKELLERAGRSFDAVEFEHIREELIQQRPIRRP